MQKISCDRRGGRSVAVMACILCVAVFLLLPSIILSSQPDPINDAKIDKEFETVVMQLPLLLAQGGATVVETEAGRFFIAVGVTDVREESAQDKLRRIRVGRVQAQKEAVSFLEHTKVVAEEKLVEKTTVTTQDGKKIVEALKTLDQSTVTTVQGVLGTLPQIGTWESADGKLFFYAIGKKLN